MKQTKSHIHRHTRRRILSALTACGLFLSLSITGCSNAPEENDSSTKNTTASAETSSDTASSSLLGDFTAVTQSGETVDQTLFAQADITMINVWTTFCTYCLDENACASVSFRRIQRRGISGRRHRQRRCQIRRRNSSEYHRCDRNRVYAHYPIFRSSYRISLKCAVRSDYHFCRFQRKTDRRPVSRCKRSGCMGEDHRRNAPDCTGE